VYPFATAYFHKLSALLRVHPPLQWFVKYYYNLRVLRLLPCTLCPFVRSGKASNVFTYLSIFNQHRFSSSTSAPDGQVPAALSRMQLTLLATPNECLLCRNNHVHRFFLHHLAIIETSQPLHCTFGSYRRTCCIVHHLPTYQDAAYNRFDGEGCSASPTERPTLITKAASLDTHKSICKSFL